MKLLRSLLDLIHRPKLDREMDMEMRMHLERETAQNIARGMSPEEARCVARRAFGGLDQLQEEERDARGWRWIDDTIRDARYAARQLAKAPGFTTVAVLTLALGIGLNTGIFSAFKAIVMRPLPGVPASRDLVTLMWTTEGGDKLTLSYVDLRDFQQRTRSLSGLEATAGTPFSLDDGTGARRLWGEYATGGLHALLGVKPFLGRMLTPEDDRFPGAALVMVLSHAFWERQFGSDRSVIGRAVLLNGHAFTVVGVAEPGFAGTTVGFGLDVFLPVGAAEHLRPFGGNASDFFTKRGFHSLVAVGRLRPGTSLTQAHTEMRTIGAALAGEFPEEYARRTATLVSLLDSPFGAQTYVGPILGMLMGMTALVLLIMCANVANLLLARAATRQREIAIRLAVGAGRFRLIRQLLTESLLLALLGGALGGMFAFTTPELLRSLSPDNLKVPVALNTAPDATVLAFAVVASFVSAFAFGLLPAVQASQSSVLPALKAGGTSSPAARTWGRNALVVTQVAVSIPLLAAAGLLLRSGERERRADFGFDASPLALMSIDLGPNGYDEARGRAFCERLHDEIIRLPGVETASLANQLPLQTVPRLQCAVEVDGYVAPSNEPSLVLGNIVTPDYFRTLRIPLLAGREFAASDSADSPRVAIVNDTMARRYWSGRDPIGRTFRSYGRLWQVIGVARDVKYLTPTESARPHFYFPHNQFFMSEMIVQVRTSAEPRLMLKSIQDVITRLDPHLPVFGVETGSDYMEFALSLPSFAANGLLLAGALGLALTAMGIFGTVSYTVSIRAREIGVRMALGAKRPEVVALVLRQGLTLAAGGAAIGLAGAAATTGVLRSILYETTATDPLTFVAVLLVVVGTTLLACWLPARRATKVDPLIALRAE